MSPRSCRLRQARFARSVRSEKVRGKPFARVQRYSRLSRLENLELSRLPNFEPLEVRRLLSGSQNTVAELLQGTQGAVSTALSPFLQEQEVTASNAFSQAFGNSVSVSGNTMVVGAETTNGVGVAYVFTQSGAA